MITGKVFKILVFVVVPIMLIGLGFVFWFHTNNNDKEAQKIHISIRPVTAVPVSVYTAQGHLGTYTEPEFDIVFNNNMSFLRFSAQTYTTSAELKPETANIIVTLEKNAAATPQEQLLDTISTDKIISLDGGYSVRNYREYDNGKWVVGTLTTTGYATDGERVILERQNGKLEILVAGTSLDQDIMINSGMPIAVVTEILNAEN